MKPNDWIRACLLVAAISFLDGCGKASQQIEGDEKEAAPVNINETGGVILVYEIDRGKEDGDHRPLDLKALAAALKKRIKPVALAQFTVRPAGKSRIEIVLPTVGMRRPDLAQKAWKRFIDQVRADWAGKLKDDQGVFDLS